MWKAKDKEVTHADRDKYPFIASMDVEPDKEALFNEVYDKEHVPNPMKVPGVFLPANSPGSLRGRTS